MLLSLKLNLIVDIRQGHGKSIRLYFLRFYVVLMPAVLFIVRGIEQLHGKLCLLYTSDAADE